MIEFVRRLGATALALPGQLLALCQATGQRALLAFDVVACLFRYRLRWRLLMEQMTFIGVSSISVIAITGLFTGAVFCAQTQYQFDKVGMASATGPVVSISMFRELGPVLCAVMLAGRVGSAMSAELATMKITEQIDALRSLAVYPTEYLIVPRFLGLVISLPLLTALSISAGIFAGYFVFTNILGSDGTYYWHNTKIFTELNDVWIALTKSLIFGVIIAVTACYKGLTSGPGAKGVGRATTESVVEASILVLIANFFISVALNLIFWSSYHVQT